MEPFPDSYTRAFEHVGVIGTWVDLSRRGYAGGVSTKSLSSGC